MSVGPNNQSTSDSRLLSKAKAFKKTSAKKTAPAARKSGEWKQNAADLLNALRARLAGLQAAE